jgi:hypothetical protein
LGLALLALLFSSSLAAAQSVPALLHEFRSPETDARRAAFYELLGGPVSNASYALEKALERNPGEQGLIGVALIDLLERENARLQLAPPIMTEADAAYHGDLVWAVASLRDPRAAPALAAALPTGRLAIDGLVALGEPSVSVIAERAKQYTHWLVGATAALALGEIAEQREKNALTPAGLARIRGELLDLLDHEDGRVRERAVRALVHFGDEEVRQAVVRLWRTDPFCQPRDQGNVCRVRDAAKDWLRTHP